MEPGNRRRVVRALEVTVGSGRPFSTFGPGLEAYPESATSQVGVARPTEEIDARIAARFAHMVQSGLVEECRRWRPVRRVCRERPARHSGTR